MKWADPPEKERKNAENKTKTSSHSVLCVCVSIHRPYCMGLAHVFCSPPIVRFRDDDAPVIL
jgi:hypothetical protein